MVSIQIVKIISSGLSEKHMRADKNSYGKRA
jgi:hypothetical protein